MVSDLVEAGGVIWRRHVLILVDVSFQPPDTFKGRSMAER
jgi:hypothetical protein